MEKQFFVTRGGSNTQLPSTRLSGVGRRFRRDDSKGQRHLTHLLATLGSAVLLAQVSTAATINDLFTNAANWGAPTFQDGNLAVGSGRMNYTSSSTLNSTGGAGIPRIAADLAGAATLPTTQDWSLKIDAHLNATTLTQSGQFR